MPYFRHPSRFVVFSRSRRWKKGIGDVGFAGIGNGSFETSTFSSVHDYRTHLSPVKAEPDINKNVHLHAKTMIRCLLQAKWTRKMTELDHCPVMWKT